MPELPYCRAIRLMSPVGLYLRWWMDGTVMVYWLSLVLRLYPAHYLGIRSAPPGQLATARARCVFKLTV